MYKRKEYFPIWAKNDHIGKMSEENYKKVLAILGKVVYT